jgi:hypothetical protein
MLTKLHMRTTAAVNAAPKVAKRIQETMKAALE